MFRNISKITASTLKYTASFFSQDSEQYMAPEILETCFKDIQLGLNALFNDQIIDAEDMFTLLKEKNQSPFHAYGYVLFIYIKAMLSFEKTSIEEALIYLDTIIKRPNNLMKNKNQKHNEDNNRLPSLHYELLQANCVFMSATLQIINANWIDNFKAAYDLRKAFKLYEKLFQAITGATLEQYSDNINTKRRSQRRPASFNDHLYAFNDDETKKAISMSETLRQGVYFGIGLFNIIFLLLPVKARKVLTSLGFCSYQSTSIYLLQKSCNSQTMYASLSSLLLLLFYTNISIYIQPQINSFLLYEDMSLILNRMKTAYPNGKVWKLIEGKFKRLKGANDFSLQLYTEAKSPMEQDNSKSSVLDKHGNVRITSTADFLHFRAIVIYEIGWSHIYSGNYYEAAESFFCLESLCNWSRIFYHYVATCCLIANQEYDKAVLEVKQIMKMIEYKRKTTDARLSVNDQYAESKIVSWINYSETHSISLTTLLESLHNPIWELVYLWNGTCYWNYDIATYIKDKILNRWRINKDSNIHHARTKEPILCLIMGVIYRDSLKNVEVAMEYFNSILLPKETEYGNNNCWILPYAMYEIAATRASTALKNDNTCTEDDMIIVMEWVKCIEYYYLENPQDKEWDTRMQLKCQLLLASCTNRCLSK